MTNRILCHERECSWSWTFFNSRRDIAVGVPFWYRSIGKVRCSWPQKMEMHMRQSDKKTLAFEYEFSFSMNKPWCCFQTSLPLCCWYIYNCANATCHSGMSKRQVACWPVYRQPCHFAHSGRLQTIEFYSTWRQRRSAISSHRQCCRALIMKWQAVFTARSGKALS